MSGSSIWASLECQCCFWIVGGLVSYLTIWLLTLQLFKNSIAWHSREAQIEPPLIECEWAFRIRALEMEFSNKDFYFRPNREQVRKKCNFRPSGRN
jgi:hypothetical protein